MSPLDTFAMSQSRAQDIVDFFDRRAADYDREYSQATLAGHALRVRRQKVLQLFDQPGGSVLDVGCGPGVMVEGLRALDCTFCGVDPSRNTIAIASERFRDDDRVRFLQGDASRLEFSDDVFDCVLCMGVIDSVPDGQRAIGEMVRVLKPGGTLILTVANLASPYAWWMNYVVYPALQGLYRLRVLRQGPAAGGGRGSSLRTLYTKRQAVRAIGTGGAQVTGVVPYYFNVFLPPLDKIAPRAALRVTQRMERYGRPQWLAAGWILQAHKPGPRPAIRDDRA